MPDKSIGVHPVEIKAQTLRDVANIRNGDRTNLQIQLAKKSCQVHPNTRFLLLDKSSSMRFHEHNSIENFEIYRFKLLR